MLQSNDGTENDPDCHCNGDQDEINQIKIGEAMNLIAAVMLRMTAITSTSVIARFMLFNLPRAASPD